ncbi:hypothetical protein [Methylobacterium sp. Leaf85]|uniref:hypothetical protein n=1 Tax=Methylobacterium sp. Leaf85 TaxID=1736241 RepID=UPI0006F4F89F|nr:hypothetical protein [Methylobacterium sp. Leaf85]KQO53062.1 hypothetical protein ASF08_19245 [Methylobacterium sp. Leaf85]
MIERTLDLRIFALNLAAGVGTSLLAFEADGRPVRHTALFQRVQNLETANTNITASFTGFDNRLKAVESFTGVGNTSLVLDVADLQNTRYSSRPGDAPRTWTTNVASSPADVTPLTLGGAFSIVRGPGGKALRITGNGFAGPDVLIHLDKDRTVEIAFELSRPVNDPVAANNVPGIEIRGFDAQGNALASVPMPATALTFADDVITYRVLVSRTPGVGTRDMPEGTTDIRPVVSNSGTTGALNVYGVEYRDRITLASLIEAGVLASTIPDTALLGFDVNGASQKITFKDFKKMFNPDVYTTFETINVDTKSHVLVGADPNMVEINWQSAGADIAACATYNRATLDLSTPSVLAQDGGSGRIKFGKLGATAPISLISSMPCTVTVEITRLTQNYTKYKLFGDDMMSYWPRQDVDERFRAAMRTALNGADTGNLINKKARFLYCTGAFEENDAINLFNPEGPRLTFNRGTTGLITTPHAFIRGGGVDAHVETGQTVDLLSFDPNSHFMLCMAGSTALDPDGIQMANSINYYLSSNLTATKGGVRTGGGRDDLPSAPGRMIAFNRVDAGTYNQFVDGVKVGQTIARPTAAAPSGTLKLLAVPNAGGVQSASKLPLTLAMCGAGYNDDTTAMRRLYELFKPVVDVNAVIRAELVAAGGAA